MNSKTIIEPTTSAVSAPAAASNPHFSIWQGQEMTVSADVLAGAETCSVYYRANSDASWAAAGDASAAAAITLTATVPQVALTGIGEYYIAKSATASSCGVYIAF